jgi:hypothetical protein
LPMHPLAGTPRVTWCVREKIAQNVAQQIFNWCIPLILGSMLWSQFSAIFDNFRRKKLAFFSKTNVMMKLLNNLALFWVKNANFLPIYSAKIF